MFEKKLPCRERGFDAGFLYVLSKGSALEKIIVAIARLAVFVLAVADVRVFLRRFHSKHVVVSIGLTKCAIVKEVIAHPNIDHRRLRRDGFDCRMRIHAGHYRQKSGIAGADKSGAPVIALYVFKQPIYGVVSISALVDCLTILMIGQCAAHDELAFALKTAANVLAHVDVAVARQLGAAAEERGAIGAVDAVRSALNEEWQRRVDVRRFENDGVQFDTIAHGNHDFAALVIVKGVMDWFAGALIN